jgi:hypothetical protein
MSERKKRWFVNCPSCGGQFAIGDAIQIEEAVPPEPQLEGSLPSLRSGAHLYPRDMQLGEEQ